MHASRFYLEDVVEPESSQNKDNLALMERLTSEANARSQAVDRLQALEAQLEKVTNEKASWEARETKVKEDASLVGGDVRFLLVRSALIAPDAVHALSRQLHDFRRTLILCAWKIKTWRKGLKSQPPWPTVT